VTVKYIGAADLLSRVQGFLDTHLAIYTESGGSRGHIIQIPNYPSFLPSLLLKTKGRKSGRELITPLGYGLYGGEWVVVASKAGAPVHPVWFLNMLEQDDVFFQVATQSFRARWRVAEGAQRDPVWDYMVRGYAPFAEYQLAAGSRIIPVVLLSPMEEVPPYRR
jgi:deazaflavin-dependent oxidoreductase (nitroreductase family)